MKREEKKDKEKDYYYICVYYYITKSYLHITNSNNTNESIFLFKLKKIRGYITSLYYLVVYAVMMFRKVPCCDWFRKCKLVARILRRRVNSLIGTLIEFKIERRPLGCRKVRSICCKVKKGRKRQTRKETNLPTPSYQGNWKIHRAHFAVAFGARRLTISLNAAATRNI